MALCLDFLKYFILGGSVWLPPTFLVEETPGKYEYNLI